MRGGVDLGWVLVVDDDELFRRHACRTLERWVSCRPASSPSEALALADEHAGLVGALVDLVLGRVPDFLPEDIPNGVDDVAIPLRSMHPAIDIRILSGAVIDFRGALARASKAGLGFMTKCDVEDLDALGPVFRRAAEDDARRRAEHRVDAAVERLGAAHQLTDRQTQIVRLKARNLTNEQIASSLGLSVKTIEHHSTQAVQKTGRSLREWARDITPTSRTSSSPPRRSGNGRGSPP